MADIRANLSAISKEINNIDAKARSAAKNTKLLGEDLKFDPTNIQKIQDRFKSLDNELKITNDLIAKITQRQEELKGIDTTGLSKEEIREVNKLLDQLQRKLDNAQMAQTRLAGATSETTKNQQYVAAATKNAEDKYGKFEEAANKVRLVVVALVAVLGKLTNELVKQSTELISLSTKYNANIEDIQKWNKALYLATGQSDLFTNSLSVMTKGFSQIAAGRGVAYRQALNNIGLAYANLAELSPEEQFNLIVEALGNVTNSSERSAAAITLLGDSGQTIAGIFDQSGQSLDEYLEEANQFAYITTENAARIKELGVETEVAKSYLQVLGSEVLADLLPLFEVLADIVKALSPIIKDFANNLQGLGKGGQVTLVVFALLLVLLPKLTTVFKALGVGSSLASTGIQQATVAGAAFNVVFSKWQIVLTAVAAVVLLLTQLIGSLINKTKSANDELSTLVDTQNSLSNLNNDFTTNTESVTTSNTERTVNIQAEIYGHGDTEISDEAAMNVAQLTVDQIQKSLGDMVK